MNQTYEEFLEHHGVKGQKWGIRNKKQPVSGRSKSGPRKTTKYSKHPSQLTDAQLQTRIKRLQMEKQYKDLNSETRAKGKAFVEDIAKKAVSGIAVATLVGVGMLGVKSLLKKKGIEI
jgi:hypothetical protein